MENIKAKHNGARGLRQTGEDRDPHWAQEGTAGMVGNAPKHGDAPKVRGTPSERHTLVGIV